MKIKANIRERITSAANALVADGVDTPTNEQVRERMGGGSLSHISPVMRGWRDSRKADIVAALEIPSDLKKIIESSISNVWTAASQLATSNVERVRQDAVASVDAAEGDLDEALVEIKALESKVGAVEQALADRDRIISQLTDSLEKERSRGFKLETSNAGLFARVDDRSAQVENLKGELKEARGENKNLQAELINIARGRGD